MKLKSMNSKWKMKEWKEKWNEKVQTLNEKWRHRDWKNRKMKCIEKVWTLYINGKWKNGKRNEMKKCEHCTWKIKEKWKSVKLEFHPADCYHYPDVKLKRKKPYWLQTSNERPSTKSKILIVFKFHSF